MAKDIRGLYSAINDFRRARNQAALKEIIARFTGESNQLLAYDEVRKQLKLQGSSERGLQDIPIDAIVGSVGRYTDFTRDFLPTRNVDEERWARIQMAYNGLQGLPPIEVYQIGEVYFVKDGNHRVSVARQLGAKTIQAYVTEIRTRVKLTPDIQPDDLIVKAEYAEFLEITHLDELRPDGDLSITVPGKYEILLEHINMHRFYLGIDYQRDVSFEETVMHWYDTVYLPVVKLIRERGILHFFPDRTETDLYLWIGEHRAALEEELGWDLSTEAVVQDLVTQYSSDPEHVAARLGENVLRSLSLTKLEPGPPPGTWRQERMKLRREDRLFSEILVPVNGLPTGWNALDQAIIIARCEGALLHGLHVVANDEELESEVAKSVRQEFRQRCEQAGVQGDLVLAAGEISTQICSRSRWTDLIVVNLDYPPAPQLLARLESGFRDLIQRCPRPVLAAPKTYTPMQRLLLAYDRSPKSKEALYVATYLAGQCHVPLVVVSVTNNELEAREAIQEARAYLDGHGMEATFVEKDGDVAQTILKVCNEYACDFLVMGGYGYNPVLEIVLGSTVDQVLREGNRPTLICR